VSHSRSAVLRGAASGFLLLACCGGGSAVTPPVGPTPLSAPCKLTNQTRFPDDPKLVEHLALFSPPLEATADELNGHCNTVWQTVVEEKHCGDVVIPTFCETQCGAAEEPKCTEGNGRGLVMQRCREESIAIFQTQYAPCKDFVLCAEKLQSKTVECAAGRQ
jgi:hypothetical protein